MALKRTRPIRRRHEWQREFDYGWVVQASAVRSGNTFPTTWMADYDRGGGLVPLTTNLQEAQWFPNEKREAAERTAHFQLGHVKAARRDKMTGIVEMTLTFITPTPNP